MNIEGQTTFPSLYLRYSSTWANNIQYEIYDSDNLNVTSIVLSNNGSNSLPGLYFMLNSDCCCWTASKLKEGQDIPCMQEFMKSLTLSNGSFNRFMTGVHSETTS